MSKTYLSGRVAALSPEGHFIARSAFFRLRSNFIARSAFILLLWLGGGCVLFAQSNGVTVSNLAVDAGSPTTVTFDVSWSNTGMPDVWSDTVWVFVDYNDAGVMKRLPLTSATATAGTVTKVSGNDKGVWIAGNARSAGSFSATVRLLTTVSNVAGACAYASNYPPVGEYTSSDKIEFTGTPMYEISLAKPGGGSVTVMSGDTLLLPCNYTVTSFSDATGAPGVIDESGALPSCTAPGSTVNFTAFNPCTTAAAGATWTLQDTREAASTNTEARARTYKVKKMQDGRIWMVQDLKFGDKCANNSFYSGSDSQSKVSSVFMDFYGNCTAATNTSTPSNRGYLYDWAAAINKSGAYYGSTLTVGCSGTGTAANACQGICPDGWHIPTGNTTGEYQVLHNAMTGCTNDGCWNSGSAWEGVLGGLCVHNGSISNQGSHAYYWSSTYANSSSAYYLYFYSNSVHPGTTDYHKRAGYPVRCVRNY